MGKIKNNSKKQHPNCGQKCPLAEPDKINYFARKWRWKYFDRYPDIGEGIFADECFALGFGMDSGKWFIETFPDNDVQSPRGLRMVISQIDDLFFLGTAIFSYWRYQTHWADWCGMAIYSDEVREWMLIAFDRLIELTDSDDSDFVIEDEFWGKCDVDRAKCRFVKRADGTVVAGNDLQNKLSVAGVHFIPDREIVLNEIKKGEKIVLVREPDNKHDENSIRVETFFPRHKIGYIPRQTAAVLAVELDRGFDHIGKIAELDAKSRKITVSISRREILPLDDVTSVTLREFGGNPTQPEWEYKTTVNFLQKKFVRHIAPPQNRSAVFELKFTDKAWHGFALRELRRCNLLSWAEEQYDEVTYDIFGWEMIIRRGKKYPVWKFSGGRPLPILWERFQNFIQECQNLNEIKGDGRFYIEPLKKEKGK